MDDIRELRAIRLQEERAGEEVIDLRQYWNTINRKKWPIIRFAALTSIIALLVVYAMTPMYKATATLLIESQEANVVSIQEVYGLDTRAQQYYETQFEILKSRPLAERVIEELTLTTHEEFVPEEESSLFDFDWRALSPFALPGLSSNAGQEAVDPIYAATKVYVENLGVEPLRKTQLVKVSYESADPKLAATIANAHANAYIDSSMDARIDMTQSASSWMNRRIEDLRQALEKSEAELQAFREQEKIVDVEGLQSLPAKEINELSTRLIEVRRELAQAKTAYLQVRQLRNANVSELSALPAVLEDPLVQRLRESAASAESKVAELGKRYGPRHKNMIAAQSELAAANESLARHMGNVTGSLKTRYENARDQEKELSDALAQAKEQYHDFGRKESKFRSLQQAVESNRALYDMFYNRIQETSQTGDMETAHARVISPAIAPEIPVKPKKMLIVALVFVLSIMIGVIAAFLLEAMDNTIKSLQDIEEKLKRPMLGMIPLVKMKEKNAFAGHLFFNPQEHGFSEAVRTVRTGLSLSNLDNPYQVIMVTSSVSGEGKSTTSSSLAFAFGQMEKVLLIDADMRRPSIAKEFNIARDHMGLSELVAGDGDVEECIVHRPEENIDVLSAGLIPPNPLELLSSRKFNATVKKLREQYDRIIIDCAPTLPVSDARVISTMADALVYVVKADATSVHQVKSGLDHLDQVNAPVTGVVLNQLDVRKAEKYSDYGYGTYYESYQSHPA